VEDILLAHPGNPYFSAKRVALVDDGARINGWHEAVTRLVPGVGVFYNVDDLLRQDDSWNVIILDLSGPEHVCGLEALRRVRALRPGVPVLALGRIDDSLRAVRAIRLGATDFIARSLTCQRDLDACFFFADEFRVKVCLLAKLGADELSKNYRRQFLLQRDSRWRTQEERTAYDRRVEDIAANSPETSRFFVPPTIDELEAVLNLYLSLLLEFWQKAFRFTHVSRVPAERGRVHESREYRLRAPDDWLYEHLLGSALDTPSLVRASAILAGNCAEFLAMSRWCLDNTQPLELRQWGGSQIEISALIREIKAEFVWLRRNDAASDTSFPWTLAVLPKLLDCVFGAIYRYGEPYGWISGAGA
jgi:CheY-like chemotaxis protein